MKTYTELFMNPYFPDLKVLKFVEISSKNEKIDTKFAENSQNLNEYTQDLTKFDKNTDLFPSTVIIRDVTPRKSIFSKIKR